MKNQFNYNQVWFTSDLHFNHNNIITKFQFRPFRDVEHMNRSLIERWNSVVKKEHFIFILGDFAMHLSKAQNKEILDQLNGIKYFVPGNHDSRTQLPIECFAGIKDIMDIKIREKDGTVVPISLCHYPMLSWRHSHHGSWQLYGHLHGGDSNKELANDNFSILSCIRPQQLDVGTDAHNYFPVSYQEIKMKIKIREFLKHQKKPSMWKRLWTRIRYSLYHVPVYI